MQSFSFVYLFNVQCNGHGVINEILFPMVSSVIGCSYISYMDEKNLNLKRTSKSLKTPTPPRSSLMAKYLLHLNSPKFSGPSLLFADSIYV